jgi:predicted transposase YbfD/YdcC
MDAQAPVGMLRFFQAVPDPRRYNKSHPLSSMMAIAIMAVLCGMKGWTGVEAWGLTNYGWLKDVLDLPHGIPSHDTFARLFQVLDPVAFEACFQLWTRQLAEDSNGQFIAVDGKTICQSYEHAWSKTPVHLVSAFVSENHLILGQLATHEKSNEITVIPELLAMLVLTDRTVTIDAMGCQRNIAATIVAQDGHYILAVKENQPALCTKVTRLMDEMILEHPREGEVDYCEEIEDHHGRREERRVWASTDVQYLGEEILNLWPDRSP